MSVSDSRAKVLPKTLPQEILVRGFHTPDAVFQVDRYGRELRDFQATTRERLTRQLVRRLRRHVAPARAIAETAPAPRGNYWLLEGEFIRVNQGSRLLRAGIGFGAGGTKVETVARLYDLSGKTPRLLLTMSTTGGSNAEPGAIGAFNPVTMAFTPIFVGLNALGGARHGLTFDTVRTAREIVAVISEFSHHAGLIPKEQVLSAKRLGQLPPHLTPWEEPAPFTPTPATSTNLTTPSKPTSSPGS